ncbi:hypothetical protein SAMN05421505_1324 [Sinosporangium album]|uniref:Uncharacterized protein n=1 Tax=Sinosporangium album TaxID=504805 RepID=A0A1G8HFE7_9ACTN|nr:hypothetical protein SAMN05421505_1324 [Sinosporangium album]
MRDTRPPEIPSKPPSADPIWASRQAPLPRRVPGAHWPASSRAAHVPPADSRLSAAVAERLLRALRNHRLANQAKAGPGA